MLPPPLFPPLEPCPASLETFAATSIRQTGQRGHNGDRFRRDFFRICLTRGQRKLTIVRSWVGCSGSVHNSNSGNVKPPSREESGARAARGQAARRLLSPRGVLMFRRSRFLALMAGSALVL